MPRTASKSSTRLTTCFPIPRSAPSTTASVPFRALPAAQAAPGGYQYVDFDDLFGGGFGMGDLFSSFFGGAAGGRANVRKEGRDMGVGLRLTLEEVAAGAKKEIVYDRLAPCEACGGSGMGEGGHEIDCPECEGRGRVVTVQRTFLGDMQTASTCRNCGGTGKVIENPCEECEGQGRIPDRQHVTVEVPAGIREGQQLRVSGFGEAGMHGAKAGDLIVTCRHRSRTQFFEREGDNLHARANVSFIQATLGAEIEIDGIFEDEKVQVRIPEGCQNEQIVRVKGMGMPRLNSDSRGDMYVHINVLIPKKVTKKQRELLRRWRRSSAKRSPMRAARCRSCATRSTKRIENEHACAAAGRPPLRVSL